MAVYAEFYNRATPGYPAEYVEQGKWTRAMGSDGVMQIDARLRRETQHATARHQIRRLRYVQRYEAYRLFTGSIRAPHYITPFVEVPRPIPDPYDIGLRRARHLH